VIGLSGIFAQQMPLANRTAAASRGGAARISSVWPDRWSGLAEQPAACLQRLGARPKLRDMSHIFPIRVYYEDTDMGGIVYHANYLKFIERARSDWVAEMGIDQRAMKEQGGTVFAVRRVECDYLMAARFDDRLEVRTDVQSVTGSRLVLRQQVSRDGTAVFAAVVTIACLTDTGQPARLPANIRLLLH
jgi:acyl-CoA thioester hydrolase